jgi:hypothetical protein
MRANGSPGELQEPAPDRSLARPSSGNVYQTSNQGWSTRSTSRRHHSMRSWPMATPSDDSTSPAHPKKYVSWTSPCCPSIGTPGSGRNSSKTSSPSLKRPRNSRASTSSGSTQRCASTSGSASERSRTKASTCLWSERPERASHSPLSRVTSVQILHLYVHLLDFECGRRQLVRLGRSKRGTCLGSRC